jgi:hypothetical protein
MIQNEIESDDSVSQVGLLEQPSDTAKIVNNDEKEKKIVDWVVKEFVRYEAFHRDRFDRCRKIYDRWKNVPPPRDYDWQNQINVPVMFEGEQTITPRIFTALFPNDAPVDVQAEGDVKVEQAIRIKGILQHFFRVNNVKTRSIPMLTQNTLFGTGYADAGSWYVRKGWIIDEQGSRSEKVIESRPDFKPIDFFEIFPHPAKVEVWDGMPVIRRRFVDAELLKRMAGDGKIMNLEKALNSKGQPSDKNYQKEETDEYELIEMWGPHDDEIYDDDKKIKARKGIPYWCAVINRQVLIRHMPNPYNHQMAPIIKVKLFEDAKPCWFGYGLGEAGLPTQDRLNKIVNQRLDNVDLVLNKQGFFNGNDPLINTKKLEVSRPGQWHRVSDTVTSIRWMDTPDVTQSSYNEEKLAKDDFRESTGAVQQLMPTGEGQHRTAMGINMLTEAAGIRFRPTLARMEIDFIQATAQFYFANLKQFMTEDQWVVITGKNGETEPIKITPEQIQAKVMFVPTGLSETINKETQLGQLLRYREITAQDPTVNRREINYRIAELFGFKDLHKIAVPGMPVSRDGLPTGQQLAIQQRVAEGASPEQIKMEMLGPRPAPDPREIQRIQGEQGGQGPGPSR